MIDPNKDGVDHINVYSKGKTSLGRKLSNFYELPIETVDGKFNSIEGYWYWLGADDVKEKEELRSLSGYDAKEIGQLLADEDNKIDQQKFKSKINKAIWVKVNQPEIKSDFLNSSLPFEHYYVYGGKAVEGSAQWIMNALEKMRSRMKSLKGSEVVEENGDLFELSNKWVLAHCVSADGKLGAGIAKQFSSRFEGIGDAVKKWDKDRAAFYDGERQVYNLITKERYFEKPTYSSIQSSLEDMKSDMLKRGLVRVGMPRIGSGLDKKKWSKVKKIIEEAFHGSGIRVKIKTL